MYKTKDGKEIFVIDAHTHLWDGSVENQANRYGKGFIECFYAYHKMGPRTRFGALRSSRNTAMTA